MAGGFRWLFFLLLMTPMLPTLAQQQASTPVGTSQAAPITQDAQQLLELGQLYMGQNNPAFTLKPASLEMDARNQAGEQALRTFRQLTALYPKFTDGWLWLGITLTETLQYSKKHPDGAPMRTAAEVAEGVRAFRTAYELKPDDLIYTSYYGEALMVYREDFDAARTLWERYLTVAKTDMQRVTALTQAARACLNKSYFGKIEKKLSAHDAKEQFAAAEAYIKQAVAICPNASDVKSMQALLQKYRGTICGN